MGERDALQNCGPASKKRAGTHSLIINGRWNAVTMMREVGMSAVPEDMWSRQASGHVDRVGLPIETTNTDQITGKRPRRDDLPLGVSTDGTQTDRSQRGSRRAPTATTTHPSSSGLGAEIRPSLPRRAPHAALTIMAAFPFTRPLPPATSSGPKVTIQNMRARLHCPPAVSRSPTV